MQSSLPAVPDLATRVAALEAEAAHTQHQIRALAERIGTAEANAVEALQKPGNQIEVKP